MGWDCPERPVEVRTTKPGRLWLSEPSPYQAHEPIAGRPEMVVPVFMKVWAGSWLMASVRIERMMQMSSAILWIFGKSVEISCPDLPTFLNSCVGPRQTSFAPWSWAMGWPLVNDSGIGLPFIFANSGL